MTLIDKAEVQSAVRAYLVHESSEIAHHVEQIIAALPAVVPGVKPFGWVGGNAACTHAHVNELADGLQSCTSCGAVRSTTIASQPARDVREAALVKLLRVVFGMADEGCEAPNAAYRWCERIEEVFHDPDAARQYEDWARDIPQAILDLIGEPRT